MNVAVCGCELLCLGAANVTRRSVPVEAAAALTLVRSTLLVHGLLLVASSSLFSLLASGCRSARPSALPARTGMACGSATAVLECGAKQPSPDHHNPGTHRYGTLPRYSRQTQYLLEKVTWLTSLEAGLSNENSEVQPHRYQQQCSVRELGKQAGGELALVAASLYPVGNVPDLLVSVKVLLSSRYCTSNVIAKL